MQHPWCTGARYAVVGLIHVKDLLLLDIDHEASSAPSLATAVTPQLDGHRQCSWVNTCPALLGPEAHFGP